MSVLLNNDYLYHDKQNIIVVWQAKAACTLITKMFFTHEGLYDIAMNYSKWVHNYRMKHSQENYITRNNALIDVKAKYIQFTINPYKRAVSSYFHSMKTSILIFKEKNNYDKNKISFKEFLLTLKNGEVKPNIHFNYQTFYKNDEVNIEKFKIEHIESLLPYINEKYDLNYVLTDEIKYSKHYTNTVKDNKEFCGNTSWDEVKHNIPYDYTLFYNDEIKNIVDDVYKLDIQNLNYTWDEFLDYYK